MCAFSWLVTGRTGVMPGLDVAEYVTVTLYVPFGAFGGMVAGALPDTLPPAGTGRT